MNIKAHELGSLIQYHKQMPVIWRLSMKIWDVKKVEKVSLKISSINIKKHFHIQIFGIKQLEKWNTGTGERYKPRTLPKYCNNLLMDLGWYEISNSI